MHYLLLDVRGRGGGKMEEQLDWSRLRKYMATVQSSLGGDIALGLDSGRANSDLLDRCQRVDSTDMSLQGHHITLDLAASTRWNFFDGLCASISSWRYAC